MNSQLIKNILVVGNRASGWIASYLLASAFSRLGVRVTYADLGCGMEEGAAITSVCNYEDMQGFLSSIGVSAKTFFDKCGAFPYVGNRYSDAARNIDFIHSLSGYERSYGRRANDDLVPLLKQIVKDINYQDFSLIAQMALHGGLVSPERMLENPQMMKGVGVSFSSYSLSELLKESWKDKYFSYRECVRVSVERGVDGTSVLLDGEAFDADLYLDVTGASEFLMSSVGERDFYPSVDVKVEHQKLDVPANSAMIDCCYNQHGLTMNIDCGLRRESISFVVNPTATCARAFILQSPWVDNFVALGEAAGAFPKVFYSEIDLVLSQVRLLIEAFPRPNNFKLKQQYFNRISYQQLYWLYLFNWMVINFNKILVDQSCHTTQLSIPQDVRERLIVFSKTGFVFTEDYEIFSDVFWKSFFIGSGHLYSGGNGYLSNNIESLIDLLTEKVSIHREISQMREMGYFS